jgi:hypothetical protein
MAMHGRHSLVETNLRLLSQQKCKIVVVATLEEDINFLKSLETTSLHIVPHSNYTLGAKWDAGVQKCKELGANPLIIVGSDDFLSANFIEKACELSQKYDFIYFTKWYIFDQISLKSYFLRYRMIFPLGSGRVFSGSFLDRMHWKLFDSGVNHHLDDYVFDNLTDNDRILMNPDGMSLLAVKGRHETMNPLKQILQADSITWDYCEDIDKHFGFYKPIKELFR